MDLKDICIEIAKKYNIDSIGLFGSRARGDFNEQSDYDIFIIGNIDLNTELRLEYDLEKKLDSEVDVIKINNETDKMFLKNILNEAIVFLDDKGKFNSTYREIEKFFIENSDLFVCEGTYGKDEDIEKAIKNKHMTFREAAILAREGKVKELILTHFSTAITEPKEYINNGKSEFKNIILGEDGLKKELKFSD